MESAAKPRFSSHRAVLVGLFVFVAVLGPSAAAARAATRYVATTGTDLANDCLLQALPCATIQHAIDEAAAADTVEVAAGSYVEALTVSKELTLRGPNAGIDPNAGSRGPEAVIDGGGGTAIIPQVPEIAIEGFTISTDDAGFPIYTAGTDITGLTVANNILGTGVRALSIATSGEGLSILRNRIDGGAYGMHFGAGTYANLRINENVVLGPVDTYAIFINGNGAIDGFELMGNTITDVSNIAANITEGLVSGNGFDVEAAGAMNLQINLHDSSLTDNTFDGNATTGCLQLFGSQFGLVPSKKVMVSENSFGDCNVYGIQLSPDIEEITITGNTITDAKEGINTRNIDPWDVTGNQIEIFANRIVRSTDAGISNSVAGTLDARNNWWGCNAGPGGAGCGAALGSVETSPHIVLSGETGIAELAPGASTPVAARLDRNSAGEPVAGIPDGPTVSFAALLGSFSPAAAPLTSGIVVDLYGGFAGRPGGCRGRGRRRGGRRAADDRGPGVAAATSGRAARGGAGDRGGQRRQAEDRPEGRQLRHRDRRVPGRELHDPGQDALCEARRQGLQRQGGAPQLDRRRRIHPCPPRLHEGGPAGAGRCRKGLGQSRPDRHHRRRRGEDGQGDPGAETPTPSSGQRALRTRI